MKATTTAPVSLAPRPEVAPARAAGLNLLGLPLVRRLLLSRYMPLALQVPALLLFGWALYDGFFGAQAKDENFATLGVWFLFFWPVILISLVLFGRAWCAVCPVGTLTAVAGHWTRGWAFPKRLRNGALSLAFFVAVLWVLRPLLGVADSPWLTAWFLVFWTVVALVVGLLYVPRAFCRYMCPLAAPLGLFARVAPVALRAGEGGRLAAACQGCAGHECYKGSATVGGCPMGEFPAAMESNAHCIFCLKCLKSCPSKSAPSRAPLQIRLRWPFAELGQVRRPQLVDGLTAIALAGVFLWHMAIGHAPRTPAFLELWSHQVHQLEPAAATEDVHYLVTFVFALGASTLLVVAAAALTARLARRRFREALALAGYPLAALVAFRALGYTVGDLLTKSGDLLNYLGGALGVHLYYPSALVSTAFSPIVANTNYHLYGALLTIPLALGLPVALLLAYRAWRRRLGSAGAFYAALPAALALAVTVLVYETAYLVGYRVLP